MLFSVDGDRGPYVRKYITSPVLPTKALNIIIGVSIVRLAVLTRCLEVAKFDGVVSNFCKSGRPYYQTIRRELREHDVEWTRNGMTGAIATGQ